MVLAGPVAVHHDLAVLRTVMLVAPGSLRSLEGHEYRDSRSHEAVCFPRTALHSSASTVWLGMLCLTGRPRLIGHQFSSSNTCGVCSCRSGSDREAHLRQGKEEFLDKPKYEVVLRRSPLIADLTS